MRLCMCVCVWVKKKLSDMFRSEKEMLQNNEDFIDGISFTYKREEVEEIKHSKCHLHVDGLKIQIYSTLNLIADVRSS